MNPNLMYRKQLLVFLITADWTLTEGINSKLNYFPTVKHESQSILFLLSEKYNNGFEDKPGQLSQYINWLWAARLGLGFDSWQGQQIFLFSKVSRQPRGSNQPPIQ
jgi:hypothetical protein